MEFPIIYTKVFDFTKNITAEYRTEMIIKIY